VIVIIRLLLALQPTGELIDAEEAEALDEAGKRMRGGWP